MEVGDHCMGDSGSENLCVCFCQHEIQIDVGCLGKDQSWNDMEVVTGKIVRVPPIQSIDKG